MYDQPTERFYMVCDTHPFSEFEVLTNLPYSSKIYYLENAIGEEMDYALGEKKNQWKEILEIDRNVGEQRVYDMRRKQNFWLSIIKERAINIKADKKRKK